MLIASVLVMLGVMAGCSQKTPFDPSQADTILTLVPQSVSHTFADTVLTLNWNEPLENTSIGGYFITMEFEDEGAENIGTEWGSFDTTKSYVIGDVVVEGDTLVDTIWSINVTANATGLVKTFTDDIANRVYKFYGESYYIFEHLAERSIPRDDPRFGVTTTNTRKIIIEEDKIYTLSYYVAAWMLNDQNYSGSLDKWKQLPIISSYGYLGKFTQPFTVKFRVTNNELVFII